MTEIFPGEHEFSETALAGNQWIEDMDRVHFNPIGAKSLKSPSKLSSSRIQTQKVLSDEDVVIILNPMQIRTFVMSEPVSMGIKSQLISIYFLMIVFASIMRNLF